MLSQVEQTLFTRVTVFVGGFTVEAAEVVCEDRSSPSLTLLPSPNRVLVDVASLLDKSLLQRVTGLYGKPRYVMLETVREDDIHNPCI